MPEYTLYSQFGDIEMPEEETVPELLLAKCRKHAASGKACRITDAITGESFDFESFERLTRNIASALYKRGLRKGDIVIYMMMDIVKLHTFCTGIWRANGIPRACYPEEDEDTLLERVKESRAGWIYCEPELAGLCLSVVGKTYWDVEIIVNGYADMCTSIYNLMDDDGQAIPPLLISSRDPAVIFSTSGTTGASKGALITHDALIRQMLTKNGKLLDKNRINLLVGKGTHMSGLLLPAVAIIDGAGALVISKISPINVFEAIRKYQPRHLFAFPAMLVALVNHPDSEGYDFSCIKWASTGGAPLTAAMQKIILQLPSIKHVYNLYGMTEVGPIVTTFDLNSDNHPEDSKLKDCPESTAGKITRGVAAQFRDLETDQVLGPNQVGELCIQFKGNFRCYFRNRKATEASMIDGFFRTGDIGYFDEDEFIFLVDRAKEIFKYCGNHVSPTEIENVVNQHPGVAEVCVIGVPDPFAGHLPRAVCVPKRDVICSPEEVQEFANSRLADFKQLRGGVYFVDQLPKGKTGKVTRQLVEQIKLD